MELIQISRKEQENLIKLIIEKIIVQNKLLMNQLQRITNQPAQLDSGYIGQHLVSIVTKIKGGGFRGKGLDLSDGSEVKTANFLDSMDAYNQVAPRWNFQANNMEEITCFLNYPAIYLVLINNFIDISLNLLKKSFNNIIFLIFINKSHTQIIIERYKNS